MVKNKENFTYQNDVRFVIEVKRRESAKSEVKKDLQRLAKFLEKSKNPHVRCFLLYISQDKRPDEYVTKEGKASGNKNITIKKSDRYVARSRMARHAIDKFYIYEKKEKRNKKILT